MYCLLAHLLVLCVLLCVPWLTPLLLPQPRQHLLSNKIVNRVCNIGELADSAVTIAECFAVIPTPGFTLEESRRNSAMMIECRAAYDRVLDKDKDCRDILVVLVQYYSTTMIPPYDAIATRELIEVLKKHVFI